MTSPTRDLAAVEERLEKLEQELRAERRCNRWLLATVGLAAMGVVLAWSLANTATTVHAQVPKVIRANEFILEDQDGKTRASLIVLKDGPILTLLDENGTPRVGLSGDKDGPGLSLRDGNGKNRVILAVTTGGPWLQMLDRNGKKIWSQP